MSVTSADSLVREWSLRRPIKPLFLPEARINGTSTGSPPPPRTPPQGDSLARSVPISNTPTLPLVEGIDMQRESKDTNSEWVREVHSFLSGMKEELSQLRDGQRCLERHVSERFQDLKDVMEKQFLKIHLNRSLIGGVANILPSGALIGKPADNEPAEKPALLETPPKKVTLLRRSQIADKLASMNEDVTLTRIEYGGDKNLGDIGLRGIEQEISQSRTASKNSLRTTSKNSLSQRRSDGVSRPSLSRRRHDSDSNPIGMCQQGHRLHRHIENLVSYREKTRFYNWGKAPEPEADSDMGSRSRHRMFQRCSHLEKSWSELIGGQDDMGSVLPYFHFCFARSGRLEKLVESGRFEFASFLCIFLNLVWIAITIDFAMDRVLTSITPIRETWFDKVDIGFSVVFLIELILRVGAFRIRFFLSSDWLYNLADVAVVVATVVSVMLGLGPKATPFRTVRLLKVMRLFQKVNFSTAFAELQHFIATFTCCVKVAAWGILFVAFCTFLVALLQMEFILNHAPDSQTIKYRGILRQDFRSIPQTMLTLVHCATNGRSYGQFAAEARPHVPMSAEIIHLYVAFMLFCVLPIITGEFVMKVQETRRSDPALQFTDSIERAGFFLSDLVRRCKQLGFSMTDRLDVRGLDDLLQSPDIESFLFVNDMDFAAADLFSLIDFDGNDEITVQEFTYACQWMKNCARPTDMMFLSEQVASVKSEVVAQKEGVKALARLMADWKSILSDLVASSSVS